MSVLAKPSTQCHLSFSLFCSVMLYSATFVFLKSFASSVFCKFQSFLSVFRHWQWLHRLKIHEGQNSAAWTCSETIEVFSWDGARGNSGPLRVGYISPDFYSHSASALLSLTVHICSLSPGALVALVHSAQIKPWIGAVLRSPTSSIRP